MLLMFVSKTQNVLNLKVLGSLLQSNVGTSARLLQPWQEQLYTIYQAILPLQCFQDVWRQKVTTSLQRGQLILASYLRYSTLYTNSTADSNGTMGVLGKTMGATLQNNRYFETLIIEDDFLLNNPKRQIPIIGFRGSVFFLMVTLKLNIAHVCISDLECPKLQSNVSSSARIFTVIIFRVQRGHETLASHLKYLTLHTNSTAGSTVTIGLLGETAKPWGDIIE